MNLRRWISLIPIAALGIIFCIVLAKAASRDDILSREPFVFLQLVGYVFFFLVGSIYLVLGVASLFLRVWKMAGVHLICALLAAFVPWIGSIICTPLLLAAEVRYIERFDPGLLRAEAAQLVAAYERLPGPSGYFGKHISEDDSPPELKKFARSSLGFTVEVSRNGIIYRTAGMGGWRGGYLITPINSEHVPSNGREIITGFYYVISRGDG